MILVDAGPLIAIIDRGEPDHRICMEVLSFLTGPMLTTWPALTEAMHLLGRAGGWPAQEALWKLLHRDDLQLIHLDESLLRRTRALMKKYLDVPMDLADATLVAAAEKLKLKRILTLDSDFRIYRLAGKRSFEVIPS